MNERQERTSLQRQNRAALRKAFTAWKDLKEYLVTLPNSENLAGQKFLELNDRFIEAVDVLSERAKDAFERRISSSSVANKFARLARAAIARQQ